MIVEIDGYRIKPYPNHLCWEVFKYRPVKSRDGSVSEKWVSMGKYPSTLGHALQTVYEDALKDGSGVVSLPAAIVRAEKLNARLLAIGEKA